MQVIKLEEELSTAAAARQAQEAQVKELLAERDRARFELVQTRQWAKAEVGRVAAAAAAAGGGGPSAAGGAEPSSVAERRFDFLDSDDSWMAKVRGPSNSSLSLCPC